VLVIPIIEGKLSPLFRAFKQPLSTQGAIGLRGKRGIHDERFSALYSKHELNGLCCDPIAAD